MASERRARSSIMASVTKQTIEAAWRKRFEGGERTREGRTGARPGLHHLRRLRDLAPRLQAAWRQSRDRQAMAGQEGLAWPPGAEFHLPEAIELAREWKVKVAKGIDPAAEQKEALADATGRDGGGRPHRAHAGGGLHGGSGATLATGDGEGVRWRPSRNHRCAGPGADPQGDATDAGRRSCASSSTAPRPMGIEAPGSSGCGCSSEACLRSHSRDATGST